MCGVKPCAACSRKSKISGMARKSAKAKKNTRKVLGALAAVAVEYGVNQFTGGILSDTTGTIIKIVGGVAIGMKAKDPLISGMGWGLAGNNGLQLATGQNLPQTLGIAGIQPWRINGPQPGQTHVNRAT